MDLKFQTRASFPNPDFGVRTKSDFRGPDNVSFTVATQRNVQPYSGNAAFACICKILLGLDNLFFPTCLFFEIEPWTQLVLL